jgi:hypothetical protein
MFENARMSDFLPEKERSPIALQFVEVSTTVFFMSKEGRELDQSFIIINTLQWKLGGRRRGIASHKATTLKVPFRMKFAKPQRSILHLVFTLEWPDDVSETYPNEASFFIFF